MSFEKSFRAVAAALQVFGGSPEVSPKNSCETPQNHEQKPVKGLDGVPVLEGGQRTKETDEYILDDKNQVPPGESLTPPKHDGPCDIPVSENDHVSTGS